MSYGKIDYSGTGPETIKMQFFLAEKPKKLHEKKVGKTVAKPVDLLHLIKKKNRPQAKASDIFHFVFQPVSAAADRGAQAWA